MTLNSSSKTQEIPSYLIYEMDDGKPIYYKGYFEVLTGEKDFEEIIANTSLHAWLKGELSYFIKKLLPFEYVMTAGELGLQIEKLTSRIVNIAIFKKENFVLSNKYSAQPPEIAIEIDTKADLNSTGAAIKYYQRKNKQLFEFGVKKIIWIFTEIQGVQVLEVEGEEQEFEWSEDIPVMENVSFNLQQIMQQLQ